MNSGSDDLFESRLAQLKFMAQGLWGGHYEPKSDRDIWLAKRIDELVLSVPVGYVNVLQSEFLLMNQPSKQRK